MKAEKARKKRPLRDATQVRHAHLEGTSSHVPDFCMFDALDSKNNWVTSRTKDLIFR